MVSNYMKVAFGVLCNQLMVGGAEAQAPQAKQSPNILFIQVDDLNYEYLGCFGSKIVKTPNVDQLAREGVMFQNAVAQGMMSGPSRNSLMTGLYPHNLGFYYNGDMRALPKGIWTFPQALQRAGYYTSWVGKCHIRPAGKDRTAAMKKLMGFNFVQQTAGRVVLASKDEEVIDPSTDWYMQFLHEKGLLEHFKNEYPNISTLPDEAYLDGFFTHAALDFIDQYKSPKPLFMWLNYSVPHGPYDVAAKYHKPYPQEIMPGATEADFVAPQGLIKKTKPNKSEAQAKKEQAGISAAIAYMDSQVGKVINQLKQKGIYENTIIVFFSDQGVMLGDHNLHHKGTLYRQITNPALIISYPKAYEMNQVNHSAVELTDLIGTVLEVAQAPKADLQQCKTTHSLVPVLTGKKEKVRDYAFGEVDGYVMVTDGKHRFIKGADAALLFDDVKDPKNLHDISGQNPKVVQLLSNEIDQWLQKTGPVLPRKSY